MQKRVGVREQAEDLTGMYRDAIPSSVAEFLAQHSFAVLASEDTDKNVWASPLAGKANIFSVPDGHRVDIHLDRLDPRLDPELVRGNLAGLLVMHFDRRLRMRINGTVSHAGNMLTLHIAQFYGNCTKYIARRIPNSAAAAKPAASAKQSAALSESQRAWIERSDTFFIATQNGGSGADASHRGGRPGFATTPDAHTLVWPDYRGNNMFNTLGNLEADSRAGLLFVDFETGSSLQMTGKAVADFGDPTTGAPTGRSLRFDIAVVRELSPAAGLQYDLIEPFAYNPPLPG